MSDSAGFAYAAFGTEIRSEIELQLPAPIPGASLPYRLSIRLGEVPRGDELGLSLGAIRYGELPGEAGRGSRVRLDAPLAGAFLLDGERLIVDPLPGVDPAFLGTYVYGLVLPLVLRDRGLLVFHGSAVEVGGEALVFAGERGAGKSTIAAALARRGARVLCDDLVPVGPGPLVHPGVAKLKLLPDAYRRLVGDPLSRGAHFDGVDKYHAELSPWMESAKLSRIFILGLGPDAAGGDAGLRIARIRGADKAFALAKALSVLPGLEDGQALLGRICAWLEGTDVIRVERPRGRDSLDALVDYALERETEGLCCASRDPSR